MNVSLLSPLQWTLTGTLLIGLIASLRLLLQNKKWLPRQVWLLIWWLVLLRLLLPVSIPVSLPVSLPANLPLNLPANLSVSIAASPSPNPAVDMPDKPAGNQPAKILTVPAQTADPTAPTEPATPAPASPSKFWPLLWAGGTIAAAGFFSLVYLRGRRRFRQARKLDTPFFQQWLAEHPLRRPVSVRQSDKINLPLTYGLLRPIILLPASMPDNQYERLNYALLHEWTHIRHFDAAGKLLAAAALCLHWFNPAVWLFFLLFSRDMELACDAAVVRHCGSEPAARREYALTLLSWAENCPQPAAPGLMNSLGSGYNNKSVIEERIVSIMKVKKVSFLTLAVFGLLLIGAAVAFATPGKPSQQSTNLLTADMLANLELIDYNKMSDEEINQLFNSLDYDNMNDEELHRLYSGMARAQWSRLLEPYTQFGLGWQFDDPDMDGQGLKMYYHGHEVRGIYDEPTGNWLTEHLGTSSYGPGAVELYTVYTGGQLSGLRLATPEEQAGWDEQRDRPMYDEIQPYEQFGLIYGERGRLLYNGQLVRYFWDGYDIVRDGQKLGRAIHFEYINVEGEVDLRTKRDVIYNADGSIDPFGELLGLEVYVEENFAAMQNPAAQQVAYAEYDESQTDNSSTDEMPQQVAYALRHNNPEEEAANDQTIAERLAQYEQFGLEYREVITLNGTQRDIYFQEELVSAFIDNTRSSGLTVQSSSKPEREQFVMTEYDNRGQLIGLRLATEEEVNERLSKYQHQDNGIRFFPGYNADGERTLYYSTDGNKTRKAIAKPE